MRTGEGTIELTHRHIVLCADSCERMMTPNCGPQSGHPTERHDPVEQMAKPTLALIKPDLPTPNLEKYMPLRQRTRRALAWAAAFMAGLCVSVAQAQCGAAVSCSDQRIDEYRHESGVHVYLICAADKTAVDAANLVKPGIFTKTDRVIDSSAVASADNGRGLQRYFFAARTGTTFASRHFYTVLAQEEAALDATVGVSSNLTFATCKEGRAGSFAAPTLPSSETGSSSPSYALARCGLSQRPVWRLFRSNATSSEPIQHRLTDRYADAVALQGQGYDSESVRFCVGDSSYRLSTTIAPLSATALAAGGTARFRITVTAANEVVGDPARPSGTLVFAWPDAVTAAPVAGHSCSTIAQLPALTGGQNTRLACTFPSSTTSSQFSMDVDLTASSGYVPSPVPLLKAAATTRQTTGGGAAADGVATATEIAACSAGATPAYPCSTLAANATAVEPTSQAFTVKSVAVSGASTGTLQIDSTVLAEIANRDYIDNIYHKLTAETTWTRLGGVRSRSVAGDRSVTQFMTLPADRRGTAKIRWCSGTSAPSDPGNATAGPADPACAESAQFTTPAQSTLALTVGQVGISGASSGTITISASVGANTSGDLYTVYAYFRTASGSWSQIDGVQQTSSGGTQSYQINYTVPSTLRGTASVRVCATSTSIGDPASIGAGPSNPACSESAQFTTPEVNNSPTLQLTVGNVQVTGADTAALSVNASVTSNTSGQRVFARLFYKLATDSTWTQVTFGGVFDTNGGTQTTPGLTYSVPENARGAAAVAVCVGAPAPSSMSGGAGPGNPVCAVSDTFNTPPATAPITATLVAPATSRLGVASNWSFTATADGTPVAGPLYLDLSIPANWQFTSVSIGDQLLTCVVGATTQLRRCTLVGVAASLPTSPGLSGLIVLTPAAGAGGVAGTLVARVSASASAPSGAFTCGANETSCRSASANPQYVDLVAQPSPQNNPPTASTTWPLTCTNTGNRATPANATCGIEVVYTDGSSDTQPVAGQPNWTDASNSKSVTLCGDAVTSSCLLKLSPTKTPRTITLRAGMDTTVTGSEPDNNSVNNTQVIYDGSPPAAPTVSLVSMPTTGNVGTPYSGQFSCSGSSRLTDFTCSISANTPLPAGLQVVAPCNDSTQGSVRTITCSVTGTPTTAASGQALTVNAVSSNATPATVSGNMAITITTGPAACPAAPANSELYDTVDSLGRALTLMVLPPGVTRYIKLVPGPGWKDAARFQQLGLQSINNIIPRISGGFTGEWGISRCPGDLASSNVVQKTQWDIFMFWYGLDVGSAPLPAAQNRGANGLPGLLLPETQGGQAWYINFRVDADATTNGAAYQIF